MDFAEFEAWLLLDQGWAPGTVKVALRQLRFMEREGLDLEGFSVESGRAWLAARVRAGTSSWAVNTDVKVLNKWARFHLGEDAPFRKRATPRSQFKSLAPEDVARVLEYRHPRVGVERMRRALVLWALVSGMRVSEVARLTRGDLDPEASRFLVAHPAKRGMRRWLPVESWVWSPKRPFGTWLNATQTGSGPSSLVFPNTLDGLRRVMHTVGRQVGVPLSFTITRHTRATELLRRGWDIRYVQYYLGHRSLTSTQIYTRVGPEDVAAVMRRRPGRDLFQGT